ncbi:MAG: hypothetical protein HY550_09115 [Elusimicrobia bacterium]|nr:hypothetical protein [Elusimicrobiota bacterium]
MPSDEEKEAAEEKAAPEPEIVDLGSAAQAAQDAGSEGQYSSSGMPLSGDETPEEEAGEEPEEEQETPAEKKEKKFWLFSLGLVLLLLAGGGYFAVTGMRQAAHKLGGGSDFEKLSANSTVYDGRAAGAAAAGNADYFPPDEENAGARVQEKPKGDRVNPSLMRTKEELLAGASGKRAAQGAAYVPEREDIEESRPSAAPAGQAAMAERLQAKAAFNTFRTGSGGAKNSPSAASGAAGAFQGSGAVIGRATEQRETNSSTPKGAARGSVVEGLKSAFRASFYGARVASHDTARGWIARTFDGTQEATTAIEYDEKMRAKLDRVNPNAIPGFLREQDVSAAEAKTLSVSKVAKPKMDKEGTKEALAEDKDYQAKKAAGGFSGSMINGIFNGLSGPPNDDKGAPPGPTDDEDDDMDLFSNPEDEADLNSLGLSEYMESTGFGEECGCSEAAPCCCLPQNTVSQNCPMYGPFLPNDPCGAAMYGAAAGGVMAGQQ